MNYEEALAYLIEGNKRFNLQTTKPKEVSKSDRERLSKGQQPYAAILCCSDSRVSPEIVFDTSLNELFVVRNAGNVLTDSEAASLEYAVSHLKVPLIVVMGHEKCGAVHAVCEMVSNNDFACSKSFKVLLQEILPSAERNKNDADKEKMTIYDNIRHTKEKILNNDIVKELISTGKVSVVCAKFNILTGIVEFFG